jgi:hypothetical protein
VDGSKMMRIYDMLLAHGCVREEPTDAGAAGPRCLTLPLSGLSHGLVFYAYAVSIPEYESRGS